MKKENIDTTYISRVQAAKIYNVSTKTIARWAEKGYFPSYKINARTVRYREDELIAFVEDSKVQTVVN